MSDRGKLIILSGPSGAGKSTVVFKAIAKRPDICFSTSVTTRSPRPGEVHGREYFFVDQKRFDDMIKNGELLEHARYVSNSYGTPRAYVEEQLSKGINVVLDIGIQGARQVHNAVPDAITIFILPPSFEDLRNRLEKRGTDNAEAIEARIRRAKEELNEADFYQYLIINEDADRAAQEFSAIITAEHCRYDMQLAKKMMK